MQGLALLRMRAVAPAFTPMLTNLVGLGLGPQVVRPLNDLLDARVGSDAIRYSLLLVACVNLWAEA